MWGGWWSTDWPSDSSDSEEVAAVSEVEVTMFAVERLSEFARRVFEQFGVGESEAAEAAEILAQADLRGIDSHGIARLHAYSEMLEQGRINPRPEICIVRETPGTATVDGDNGLGLVVGPWSNRLAMDKAEGVGTGWVAVRGSNHFGIAGYYVLEALGRDQLGWAMTNTTKIVAPMWGGERMLGTNPIAIAFPGHEEPPIVIDMASPAAAFGKIEMAIRQQKSIPEGWAIDKDGEPTTDPNAMADGGAMLPLGSTREAGGHKGYCLGAMIDILSGVLSGANWGPFTPIFTTDFEDPPRTVGIGLGHMFGAMRIDAFIDPDEFKRQIDDWIRTFRKTKPAPGTDGPIIPGDPEREAEVVRRVEGIPLVAAVVEDLRDVSRMTGVPFD
jgi:L-2-hydroxycarboxylate dehydrogenase (NAD+)